MVEASECQHQRVVDVADFQRPAETLEKPAGDMRSVVSSGRDLARSERRGETMAEPFKNLLDAAAVRALGERVAASAGRQRVTFERASFVRDATRGLEALELLDRGRHVARALRAHLPREVPRALALAVGALGSGEPGPDEQGPSPSSQSPSRDEEGSVFRWLPLSALIEAIGDEALAAPEAFDDASFEACLSACHALTQRFTAEFCVRPFLQLREAATLARLAQWTGAPSEHVRRLCSEGTRTRLPWGRRLDAFIARPAPVLALLEQLKDDESEYVRRSVANNLNDLAKDHSALVIETCERWWRDGSVARRKLVTHALRTLVKRGDARALALLGMDVEHTHAHLEVRGHVAPRRVAIGGSARVSITASNRDARDARVVIDLVVHYVKKGPAGAAKTSAKVFKGKTLTVPAHESVSFERTVAFVDRSIRTHEPGLHRIEAKANGKLVPLGEVTLTRARPR
jgi:3-methyladenine DNA glycosylase AlkC